MEGANRYEQPVAGHFGQHGGRFVAETLMHALEELAELYDSLAGDQAFFAGDHPLALQLYNHLMADESRSVRLMLKLADVHHQLGNFERERQLREAVYGRLELEELR